MRIVMRSLNDDNSSKMANGVDEQCHRSEGGESDSLDICVGHAVAPARMVVVGTDSYHLENDIISATEMPHVQWGFLCDRGYGLVEEISRSVAVNFFGGKDDRRSTEHMQVVLLDIPGVETHSG
ncbi:hypothetical protein NC652_002779 [Populus alba x Populus x berolinensis]|nr:hypothetical protein NC652_002779 [Populus alba x Populus x berolinensis]